MTLSRTTLVALVILLAALAGVGRFVRAASEPSPRYEYASVRWDGRDNTHVVRPDGKVEFLGGHLKGIAKPPHSDERVFYLNQVINLLAREGFELTSMAEDDLVMRRLVGP